MIKSALYSIKQAFKQIFRNKGMSFAAVLSAPGSAFGYKDIIVCTVVGNDKDGVLSLVNAAYNLRVRRQDFDYPAPVILTGVSLFSYLGLDFLTVHSALFKSFGDIYVPALGPYESETSAFCFEDTFDSHKLQ